MSVIFIALMKLQLNFISTWKILGYLHRWKNYTPDFVLFWYCLTCFWTQSLGFFVSFGLMHLMYEGAQSMSDLTRSLAWDLIIVLAVTALLRFWLVSSPGSGNRDRMKALSEVYNCRKKLGHGLCFDMCKSMTLSLQWSFSVNWGKKFPQRCCYMNLNEKLAGEIIKTNGMKQMLCCRAGTSYHGRT